MINDATVFKVFFTNEANLRQKSCQLHVQTCADTLCYL